MASVTRLDAGYGYGLRSVRPWNVSCMGRVLTVWLIDVSGHLQQRPLQGWPKQRSVFTLCLWDMVPLTPPQLTLSKQCIYVVSNSQLTRGSNKSRTTPRRPPPPPPAACLGSISHRSIAWPSSLRSGGCLCVFTLGTSTLGHRGPLVLLLFLL